MRLTVAKSRTVCLRSLPPLAVHAFVFLLLFDFRRNYGGCEKLSSYRVASAPGEPGNKMNLTRVGAAAVVLHQNTDAAPLALRTYASVTGANSRVINVMITSTCPL